VATNLLIGYPQITTGATTLTPSSAFNTLYPETNLVYGSRSDLGQVNAANTVLDLLFDAGSASARTIDFFYIAKANIFKAQGSKRAGLTGSIDNVSYSNIAMNAAGFQSVTLYGPDSQDLIFTAELPGYLTGSLPSSTSYRYYKAHLAGSGSCPSKRYACSKIMFGQWFDFGRDPEWSGISYAENKTGHRFPLVFEFIWKGITPTIKNSAEDNLFISKERGVILYTQNYHAPLLDYRVVHCYIKSYNITPLTDGAWDISITFEEMI